MSANNETKFPNFYRPPDSFLDYAMPLEVYDWFKRCIAEFPYIKNYHIEGEDWTEDQFIKACYDRSVWFSKWFSQFKENNSIGTSVRNEDK